MNSKERIQYAIMHKQSDKLPVDFGGSVVTGIHASSVYRLRQWYGLDRPNTPVKVIEPYQMLGEIKDDLKEILGADVVSLESKNTSFGYSKDNWKEWKLHDGTPLLIPGLFNTVENEDGSIYQYPEADKNYPPSAKMPTKGYFFDAIIRQKKFKEEELSPQDNIVDFKLLSEEDLNYIKEEINRIYSKTQYAIFGLIGYSGFGDISIIPGMALKEPKGIRDIEEWYVSMLTRKKYIKKVFEGQCEISIENYKRIFKAIGNKMDIALVSGTDFGMQRGLFFSKKIYRELFKPFHIKVNKWIHDNTNWKCFIHTCGSIYDLIPDLIDAGFEIFNPIQISAEQMNPVRLKKEFGRYITFWGGGIDTQKTLPFGTTKDVKEEVKKLIDLFSRDGGFVFSTVHNIQGTVPIENIVAMIEVIQEYRK